MDEVKLSDIDIVEDDDLRISPEEMLVVDFINELQLELETAGQEQIAIKVKEKFGDLGAKVLEQLNNDIDSDENHAGECTECGKVSEEWLKKSQEKLKLIEIFLDEDIEELAQKIIDDCDGGVIIDDVVVEHIAKHDGCPADDVTSDRIKTIQTKILFMGIYDGWLVDEYFVKV